MCLLSAERLAQKKHDSKTNLRTESRCAGCLGAGKAGQGIGGDEQRSRVHSAVGRGGFCLVGISKQELHRVTESRQSLGWEL